MIECARENSWPIALCLTGAVLLSTGCVRRTIEITSTPSDALVWVNAREVGRTPLNFEFTYDGTYDVRLRHEGFKPIQTSASTEVPVWDLPGPDFFAEIAPVEFKRTTQWHFDLEPLDVDPALTIERARAMRSMLEAWEVKPQAAPEDEILNPNAAEQAPGGAIIGTPPLPADTPAGEAPVRPPELYPSGGGIQPDE